MEQIIYYFFSTVPQVIAAIVTILGAFHIFRNQEIVRKVFGNSQNILNIIGKSVYDFIREESNELKKFQIAIDLDKVYKIAKLFKEGEVYDKMHEHFDSITQTQNNGIDYSDKFTTQIIIDSSNIIYFFELKRTLKRIFQWLLVISFLIICFTLITLTFAKDIQKCEGIILITITMGLVISDLIIVFYYLSRE